MKKVTILVFLLVAVLGYSQEIIIKDNNFYQNGNVIRNSQMKTALASNLHALNLYKSARTRQSVGGFLLGFGIGLGVSDVVVGLVSDVKYPSAATYVGAGCIIGSIPFLTGNKKRINDAIKSYNDGLKNTGQSTTELNFIANTSGYGIQIRF